MDINQISAIAGIDGRYRPMDIWLSATMKVSSAIEPGWLARKAGGGMAAILGTRHAGIGRRLLRCNMAFRATPPPAVR